MITGHVEFYEDDFDLHPEEFRLLLCEMHKEYDLINLQPLLEFAEELEKYEICSVICDFVKENNIQCDK